MRGVRIPLSTLMRTYTPVEYRSQTLAEYVIVQCCDECGALVGDFEKHETFHDDQDTLYYSANRLIRQFP